MTSLLEKIETRQSAVAVIGLGYVGLPLATAFAKAGFRVVGIDADSRKVEAINEGRSYIPDVPSQVLAALIPSKASAMGIPEDSQAPSFQSSLPNNNGLQPARSDQTSQPSRPSGSLSATTDYASLADCDAIFICVPSPFDKHKTPDLTYIIAASEGVAQLLRPGHLVILQSTTYPGTTEEIVQPILQQGGLKAGHDFHLAFSPERIDPGNLRWTAENMPKVVGGLTPACTQIAAVLLGQINPQVHPVSSPRAAEMAKLLENIFRIVNIALVNELALLAERTELDIWEVIEAASTKPFGFMPFYPGPGVGGHCIPVDPYYLSWKAREYDFTTRFIDLAAEANQRMPYHVVDLIAQALEEQGKGLRGAKVLLLGAAFKPNVDDARNSPTERVMSFLMNRKAVVSYHDPYIPLFEIHPNAFFNGHRLFESVTLTDQMLRSHDCVVILVRHQNVDYGRVVQQASLIVDAVNATSGLGKLGSKVIRLGVGRRISASQSELFPVAAVTKAVDIA